MTKFVKKDEINSEWFEIDATGAVVGRLATVLSKIIRGKNKTKYTPHMDHGDFVVVKNVDQIKFTGNKFQKKKYYRHTGYPGGIKEITPEKLNEKKPGEVLKLPVYFSIDPSIPNDIKTLTLSYTFYKIDNVANKKKINKIN